jgi:hypothetical protein
MGEGEMKFDIKEDAPVASISTGVFEAITDSGHIHPEDFIEGEQLQALRDAVDVILSFERALEWAEKVEYH